MPSVEVRVLEAKAATLVAHHMRASPEGVKSILPDHAGWLVARDADVAACVQCLLDNDASNVPRFRRRGWADSWRVRCVRHRAMLVDMPDWRSRPLHLSQNGQRLQRNAGGKIVAVGHRGAVRHGKAVRIGVALEAIAQMEIAIHGAVAGRRPHAPSWGDIDAAGFLEVARDVTTFVLGRFDSSDPRPLCVRDLYRYRDDAPVQCFERHRSGSIDVEQGVAPTSAGLAQAGDVAWRRCALFWARELMPARTARPWLPLPLRGDRQRRQRAALECQTSAGIDWLTERAERWPEPYRSQWWRIG